MAARGLGANSGCTPAEEALSGVGPTELSIPVLGPAPQHQIWPYVMRKADELMLPCEDLFVTTAYLSYHKILSWLCLRKLLLLPLPLL